METTSNIHVEKQRFYIAEFEQEAAWLSFMHKEGYKFLSTDGYHYRFEPVEKEDWCYQLDYKENGVAEEDYLQMYRDFGWEYVFQYRNWFYFRKKHMEGEKEDLSIFSDRESKLELCKRIINGQLFHMLPVYLLLLCYSYWVLFTDSLNRGGFFGGLLTGIAVGALLVVLFGFGLFLGQLGRLNKMMKELDGTGQ